MNMHSLRDLVLFILYTEYPTRCSVLGHVRCPIIVCWMYAQVLEIKLLLLLLLSRSVVSDSVRPHRRQPTRLPCPWDSPGKNTGVGCHCLLQCRKVKNESEVVQSCPTLRDPMDCILPGSSVHGIFQTRVLEWVTISFSRETKLLEYK